MRGSSTLERNLGSEARIVVNLTRGNVVAERGLIVDRPRGRMRGLLGRESLPEGEGLLLQPAPSIHTAFMQFRIDVVFLDRNLQVVKVVAEMRPWRTASCRRSRTTLELAAGEIASRGLERGDQLVLIDPDASLGFAELLPAAKGDLPVDDSAEAPVSAAPATRVLLVGADRRFRAVAAALLTRRGHVVSVSDGAANVADLARREASDVVVLDGGPSLAFARRQAAQLKAADPPTGVVIVGEDQPEGATSGVVEKWGPFERLADAIERANAAQSNKLVNDESTLLLRESL
jgi:uncharacterized membrane protein (UPF0127 family)/CheY-like chemotaxis protein